MFKFAALVMAFCAMTVTVSGREYDSRMGTTEVSGGGGVAFAPEGIGNRPLIGGDLQISLSRYFSVGGGMSYFWANESILGGLVKGKVDALMYGGNFQFHIPTGTRVAPFIGSGVGALRAGGSLTLFGVQGSAQDTVFAANYGGGVRVYILPNFGIKSEFRAIKARDYDWFSTITTGVFYQFGKD